MKGLILKELYLVKSFAKQYLLLLALMAAWSVFVNNLSFVIVYIVVLGSSLVISTTAMDEAVSFNKFAVTMPVESRKLVKAKYALLFIFIGASMAGAWLLYLAINLITWGKAEFMGLEGIVVMESLFLSANAMAIPVMFKVGATKARYTYIIVMLVMGALIMGGYQIARKTGRSLDEMLKNGEGALNLAAVGFALIIVAISYFISVKIVRKKEW